MYSTGQYAAEDEAMDEKESGSVSDLPGYGVGIGVGIGEYDGDVSSSKAFVPPLAIRTAAAAAANERPLHLDLDDDGGLAAARAAHPTSSRPSSVLTDSSYMTTSSRAHSEYDGDVGELASYGKPSSVCLSETEETTRSNSSRSSKGRSSAATLASEWGISNPVLLATIEKRNKKLR
jgi:hypothetical protein